MRIRATEEGRLTVVQLIGQTGLGGAERQLLQFLRHCDRNTWDFHVVVLNSSDHGTYDEQIEEMGFTLHYCPSDQIGFLKRLRWMVRLFKSINPSVVHSWNMYANPYASTSCLFSGVPVSVGSMRSEPKAAAAGEMSFFHKYFAYKSVRHLIVNSRLAADQIEELGVSADKISVIYNGIENNHQSISDDLNEELFELGINSETKVIGTVGNLRYNKGMDVFIDGIAGACKQYPDLAGIIVGQDVPDEPETPERLRAQIKAVGMEGKIHLLGFRRDVPMLMKRFDVFAFCSRSESLPNAVVEALASGTPVVSTKAGDVPEFVVDGRNGMLFEFDDSKALGNYIVEILSNELKSQSLITSGLHTFEKLFGCERMAGEIQEIYRSNLIRRLPKSLEFLRTDKY